MDRAVYCLKSDLPHHVKDKSFENEFIDLDLDQAKLLNPSKIPYFEVVEKMNM